jgi:phage shock protein A
MMGFDVFRDTISRNCAVIEREATMEKYFGESLVEQTNTENQRLWKEIHELHDRIYQLEQKMIQQEVAEEQRRFNFTVRLLIGLASSVVVLINS